MRTRNDRETDRPRGFGLIEVDDDALSAMIQNLDGKEMGGRALRVSEALDRPRGGPARVQQGLSMNLLLPGEVSTEPGEVQSMNHTDKTHPQSLSRNIVDINLQ